MAVHLNSSGSGHAGSLVASGKIKDSGSWSAPSAEAENSYIKEHGMGGYSKWFMGVDTDEDKSTKGHYKFPFSSNFEDADYAGLRACEQRAAQAGYTDIENRAKTLFEEAKKKLGKDKKEEKSFRMEKANGKKVWVIE